MRKTKYVKGAVIKSLNVLAHELIEGHYIYWHHKPQHPGWISSMQFRSLMLATEAGILRKAKLRKQGE